MTNMQLDSCVHTYIYLPIYYSLMTMRIFINHEDGDLYIYRDVVMKDNETIKSHIAISRNKVFHCNRNVQYIAVGPNNSCLFNLYVGIIYVSRD